MIVYFVGTMGITCLIAGSAMLWFPERVAGMFPRLPDRHKEKMEEHGLMLMLTGVVFLIVTSYHELFGF